MKRYSIEIAELQKLIGLIVKYIYSRASCDEIYILVGDYYVC